MKRLMTITTVAGLLLIAGSTLADGRGQCCEQGGPRMKQRHQMMDRGLGQPGMRGMGRLHEELDLTEEQQKKMETLQEEFRYRMIDSRASLAKARLRVHSLMRSEAPESDLSRAIDELSTIRAQMLKSRLLHHRQMRTLLTPEQREKMDSMRRGRGHGFGPMGVLEESDDDFGPDDDPIEP